MTVLSAADRDAVAAQLGREPTTRFEVAARCVESGGGSHPIVIRNHPVDPNGDPFPTLYWLTCPEAVKAVSRIESTGEITRLNERFDHDEEFRAAVERAHASYARERARFHEAAAGWGGVGGTRIGVKCLHAHFANHLAGGDDPIGRMVAERLDPVHPDEPRDGRVAVFDIGTNTVRMLVAQPIEDGALADVARDTMITRLGRGVDEHGRIADESLERTLEVLVGYGRKAKALGAQRVRVGATSAVRDADNRDELARGMLEATGAPMEVLSGEDEAGLSFVGATHGLDRPKPFLVVDIGGGSTEFVLGDDAPRAAVSAQMGSVRMTERVRPADPPTPDDMARLRAEVDAVLATVPASVPVGEARTLVAVAGTATTVQAMALGLDGYDPDRVHRVLPDRRCRRRRPRTARRDDHRRTGRAAVHGPRPGRRDRRGRHDPRAGHARVRLRGGRCLRDGHPRRAGALAVRARVRTL